MDEMTAFSLAGFGGALVALASEIDDVDVDDLVASLKEVAGKLYASSPIDEVRVRKIFDLAKQLSSC